MAGLVASAALVAGCGEPGPVQVEAPEPTGAAAAECAALVDLLPEVVADQDRREVSPEDAAAGAWGEDPAIVLRCGVPEPPTLRPESPCFVVNDVGWLAEEGGDQVVFTTIGRSTYVEVSVPDTVTPGANALPALAPAVQGATRELRPCV